MGELDCPAQSPDLGMNQNTTTSQASSPNICSQIAKSCLFPLERRLQQINAHVYGVRSHVGVMFRYSHTFDHTLYL